MLRSKKIDLEKVLACVAAICPKCGHTITPAEVTRIDFDRMKCPACGETFVPVSRLQRES
jgi:predicted RNA-binding Zn-ribbon protein involved in translation (DUF1610 family)